MALNYPGPYEVRIFYSCDITPGGILQHEQRLNIRLTSDPTPGQSFGAIAAFNINDDVIDLQQFVEQWVDILRPFFSTTLTSFDFAELWKYEPNSFISTFVSSLALTGAGTNTFNLVPAGQAIFTFRTEEGGIMKVNLMESNRSVSQPLAYADQDTVEKALVDNVYKPNEPSTNAGVYWLARDTSYPFSPIKLFRGQNEKLFKVRYR